MEPDVEILEGNSAVNSNVVARVKSFMNKVYGMMAVTMLITAGVAAYSVRNEAVLAWTLRNWCPIVLGGIAIVLCLSFASRLLHAGVLGILLCAYCALEGLLFGPLLMVYTQASIGLVFTCTAGAFAATSLYGAFTGRDLSTMGRTLFMLLIGLMICFVANIFFKSNTLDLVFSGVGVVIFSALTAYDTQKLIVLGATVEDDASRSKLVMLGALTLYLDFINIFLLLLRLLGDDRK